MKGFRKKSIPNKKNPERALYASDGKSNYSKKAKGKCPKCGIYGNLGKGCKHTMSTNNIDKKPVAGTFKRKCHYCDKVGHMKKDCYAYKNREIANPVLDNYTRNGMN